MSRPEQHNLSGYWSGEYTYVHTRPPTPFNVFLDDCDGALTGTTLEPNTFADPSLDELSATISGERRGASVLFDKLYEPGSGVHRETVHYRGEANDDFTLIEGEWNFGRPGRPHGAFRLTRSSGGANENVVEDEATTDASA